MNERIKKGFKPFFNNNLCFLELVDKEQFRKSNKRNNRLRLV